MGRRSDTTQGFDAELADLPQGARWREWMLRVEAAIFAATEPVPREALGEARRLRLQSRRSPRRHRR